MNEKPDTKAQEKAELYLERHGYDYSHRVEYGKDRLPVYVNREKRQWVAVRRDGHRMPL